MIKPPSLIKGDKIGLVAPARKINLEEIEYAIKLVENEGFVPIYNNDLFSVDNQFAGSDVLRARSIQQLLDEKDIKAILSARGGYGSIRIVDLLDFSKFKTHPKWFIGFSDITVFHSHINKNFNVQTLHASMPLSFPENSPEALKSLFNLLRGERAQYNIDRNPLNKPGYSEGLLTGGNLSVLYSLMGSASFPDMDNKILFIEDLDEYLYHIDRMMMALKRAGVLENLNGLIVGGMTGMNDNEIPFGKTAYQIVREAVEDYDYPVCFGFPAGHINDNRPLIMGAKVQLDVNDHPQISFSE